MSKKVIKVQKWSFEVKTYEDGTSSMTRTNSGFKPLELLGLLNYTQDDVIKQIKGEIKPTVVKRKLIE